MTIKNKKYDIAVALMEEGKDVDLVTVANALKTEGILDVIGGSGYLTELFDAVPSAANAVSYSRIVKDKAVKRRIIALTDQISHEAQAEEKPAETLLDDAENAVYQLAQTSQPTALRQVGAFVAEAYDQIGKEEKGVAAPIKIDGSDNILLRDGIGRIMQNAGDKRHGKQCRHQQTEKINRCPGFSGNHRDPPSFPGLHLLHTRFRSFLKYNTSAKDVK